MTMNQERFSRWASYARQEYLTPGVKETLDIAAGVCDIRASDRILEVAFGKGEAACELAIRHGCSVIGVDRLPDWAAGQGQHALRKAQARRLSDRVSFIRGDGKALPLGGSQFDLALCTGGPSIVGTELGLAEMARALRPGGWLVVSDLVWRRRPVPPEALCPALPDAGQSVLLEEYAGFIRAAGFEVVLARTLPTYVWEGYYGPMLETYADLRRSGDAEAIAWTEERWRHEPQTFYERAGREYWGYAVFIGRK